MLKGKGAKEYHLFHHVDKFEWFFLPVDLENVVKFEIEGRKRGDGLHPCLYGIRVLMSEAEWREKKSDLRQKREDKERDRLLAHIEGVFRDYKE
ncbi:hypothetical protein ADUPG1_008264 [Aduncisulcus paluster]|uniref:Uncharacterized protein n=1 Tax=Aduncisulcus paluster TaxID=2918883 RepID=A0ABQ5KRB1_9EUKA|nr:hypothetical protein ADUPG1_008264 [Aduncisulcus paluster]